MTSSLVPPAWKAQVQSAIVANPWRELRKVLKVIAATALLSYLGVALNPIGVLFEEVWMMATVTGLFVAGIWLVRVILKLVVDPWRSQEVVIPLLEAYLRLSLEEDPNGAFSPEANRDLFHRYRQYLLHEKAAWLVASEDVFMSRLMRVVSE